MLTWQRWVGAGLCVLSPFSQEADKLKKAMKDEEFRKLLNEYAHEISDPENKAVQKHEVRNFVLYHPIRLTLVEI